MTSPTQPDALFPLLWQLLLILWRIACVLFRYARYLWAAFAAIGAVAFLFELQPLRSLILALIAWLIWPPGAGQRFRLKSPQESSS